MRASLLLLALGLAGCGGGGGVTAAREIVVLDFDAGPQDAAAGFADYPAGQEDFHELDAGWEAVPDVEDARGWYLNGNNHSDDLFMFLKRRVTGLRASQLYDIRFELHYATNVGAECAGIGGSPGSSVYVKAGMSATEPRAVDDGSGTLRMNVDKGNQASGGSDALVVGDMAGSQPGCPSDNPYELKAVRSDGQAFSALSGPDGALWLLAGTDSGFEGTTRVYFTRIRVELSPRN